MERNTGKFVDDFIKFALIALLIILPIRAFVAQPFIVRGASMIPTFQSGEYLIVDQLSYRFHNPERGDVIILRYPKDEKVFFIKRVIGLPGETVELLGESIVIQGNDSPPVTIEEPYIADDRIQNEYGVYTLGEGEYFVMGDNRIESSDSRSWGVLKRDGIVGRAFLRVLPPTRLDLFPGQETHNETSL
ncbi:signal peptidase I [Candidatus Kaiserbacteria bacterium CG10_big_fil_rev_8_21_14_0_10_45_20]|uniref:Signal peptidase I n=1 Tax=Candidatus Kaiserbacteria bacterium CG10_big_fil_rev_8_21_14_0_10_45_20 TaxID=1974607 RepID=A0A2H0UFZ3_9BACT|nr:MAG: signal peptidase I [Candidatus Kaiserbacteria bacterium CG10_big_fil_rev_8_21_14_0_10_45_20]